MAKKRSLFIKQALDAKNVDVFIKVLFFMLKMLMFLWLKSDLFL